MKLIRVGNSDRTNETYTLFSPLSIVVRSSNWRMQLSKYDRFDLVRFDSIRFESFPKKHMRINAKVITMRNAKTMMERHYFSFTHSFTTDWTNSALLWFSFCSFLKPRYFQYIKMGIPRLLNIKHVDNLILNRNLYEKNYHTHIECKCFHLLC